MPVRINLDSRDLYFVEPKEQPKPSPMNIVVNVDWIAPKVILMMIENIKDGAK